MSTNADDEYATAAEWAENDMTLPAASPSALRGADAAAFGRELLERAGRGRPSIDPDAPRGQHSPVRQVRLPVEVNAQLAALAEQQHRRPSAVIRDAVAQYLATHRAG